MTLNLLSALIFGAFILKACHDPNRDSVTLSATTAEIVGKITNVNQLMGDAIGYAGEQPLQYDYFIELEKKAGKDELYALTEHSNGVVRCYAFWALSHDSTVDLFPIVARHITDEEVVSTQFGCTGRSEKVGDFMINVVTPGYVDLSSGKLDSLEFVKLDSLLINSKSKLEAKSNALSRATLSDEHYEIVRALVVKKKDPSAVVNLAKYKKKEDISLIKKSSHGDSDYFVYLAIKEFPDPEFLSFLNTKMVETFDDEYYSSEWADLYAAVANYRNREALSMLKRPFTEAKVTEIRGYHMDFLFAALKENKITLYDSLLWQLWDAEGRISPATYNYLSAKDPARAFLITKKTLGSHDAMFRASNSVDTEDEDGDDGENLVSVMLDLVIERDKESGLDIIRKNISEQSVHLFPIFASKASELKDKSFIEPLFTRLETEENPHVYLEIAETLIRYNDKQINNRILLTRKKNKKLNEGWGSENLDELLKRHTIK